MRSVSITLNHQLLRETTGRFEPLGQLLSCNGFGDLCFTTPASFLYYKQRTSNQSHGKSRYENRTSDEPPQLYESRSVVRSRTISCQSGRRRNPVPWECISQNWCCIGCENSHAWHGKGSHESIRTGIWLHGSESPSQPASRQGILHTPHP